MNVSYLISIFCSSFLLCQVVLGFAGLVLALALALALTRGPQGRRRKSSDFTASYQEPGTDLHKGGQSLTDTGRIQRTYSISVLRKHYIWHIASSTWLPLLYTTPKLHPEALHRKLSHVETFQIESMAFHIDRYLTA